MDLKKCPFCGKNILVIAKTCKYCGESLEPQKQKSCEQNNEMFQKSQEQKPEGNTKTENHKTDKSTKKPLKLFLIVITTIIFLIILFIVVINSFSVKEYPKENNFTENMEVKNIENSADDINNETNLNFPDDQKIKNFINNYYTIIQNKDYYKITDFFDDIVPHYFKKTNLTNTEIRDRQIKYQEQTLKTISITPSIRWDTFEMTFNNNVVNATYLLDYYLNTEKFGNQKYVIKVNLQINKNYKIIGIDEETIEKNNL